MFKPCLIAVEKNEMAYRVVKLMWSFEASQR